MWFSLFRWESRQLSCSHVGYIGQSLEVIGDQEEAGENADRVEQRGREGEHSDGCVHACVPGNACFEVDFFLLVAPIQQLLFLGNSCMKSKGEKWCYVQKDSLPYDGAS